MKLSFNVVVKVFENVVKVTPKFISLIMIRSKAKPVQKINCNCHHFEKKIRSRKT